MASRLSPDEIQRAIPEVEDLGEPSDYGQKTVVSCMVDGQRYALKLMIVPANARDDEEAGDRAETLDEITARATREVEILRSCDCPFLVRLGPLPLTQVRVGDQDVLYFTEEWIDGTDLHTILGTGPLPIEDIVLLGTQMATAIEALWSIDKIHRDIKPRNIMRRSSGEFVLLDMGFALDLRDDSLTRPGAVPGTLPFLSPEQMDWSRKRQMDFRSDLFALGVVLYLAATKRHPFARSGASDIETMGRILTAEPDAPSNYRDVPERLESIILRLLAKRPHMRFRTCAQLVHALNQVESQAQQ